MEVVAARFFRGSNVKWVVLLPMIHSLQNMWVKHVATLVTCPYVPPRSVPARCVLSPDRVGLTCAVVAYQPPPPPALLLEPESAANDFENCLVSTMSQLGKQITLVKCFRVISRPGGGV